jgi:hypothetical protein
MSENRESNENVREEISVRKSRERRTIPNKGVLSISTTNGYLLVLLRGWAKGPVTISDFFSALPT